MAASEGRNRNQTKPNPARRGKPSERNPGAGSNLLANFPFSHHLSVGIFLSSVTATFPRVSYLFSLSHIHLVTHTHSTHTDGDTTLSRSLALSYAIVLSIDNPPSYSRLLDFVSSTHFCFSSRLRNISISLPTVHLREIEPRTKEYRQDTDVSLRLPRGTHDQDLPHSSTRRAAQNPSPEPTISIVHSIHIYERTHTVASLPCSTPPMRVCTTRKHNLLSALWHDTCDTTAWPFLVQEVEASRS